MMFLNSFISVIAHLEGDGYTWGVDASERQEGVSYGILYRDLQ